MKKYEKPTVDFVIFATESTMAGDTSALNYNTTNLNFYDSESTQYNIFDI